MDWLQCDAAIWGDNRQRCHSGCRRSCNSLYATIFHSGGVPARVIKFKWDIEQILQHEQLLYPEEERIPKEKLEEFFNQYSPAK